MNQLLTWLSGGYLRSDGLANEAAEIVLQNPALFADLFAGLSISEDVVCGRASDALEKVARARPDLLVDHVVAMLAADAQDKVPMVRWHLAMTFGHLANYQQVVEQVTPVLLRLLEDESVIVKSWAIISLCIISRKYPERNDQILRQIGALQSYPSVAVRARVRKALKILTAETAPFPEGWVKGKQMEDN